MRLRIDKAGRIVLPKPVRQRRSLVNRNGLLVHRGKLPKARDWSRLVEDYRDERMRKLAGGTRRFRGSDLPGPYSANSALAP